jgi:hypothetical protein
MATTRVTKEDSFGSGYSLYEFVLAGGHAVVRSGIGQVVSLSPTN